MMKLGIWQKRRWSFQVARLEIGGAGEGAGEEENGWIPEKRITQVPETLDGGR